MWKREYQVRNGPGMEVELLPLIIVNTLQPINEQKLSQHVKYITKGI
jgi:hypothetical protein